MKIMGPDPNSIYPIKDYDKLVFLKNFIKASNIIHNPVAAIKPLDQLEEQHIHFVLHWIESGAEIFRLVTSYP